MTIGLQPSRIPSPPERADLITISTVMWPDFVNILELIIDQALIYIMSLLTILRKKYGTLSNTCIQVMFSPGDGK